jgi:IMP cyclohydrolase
VSVNAHSPQNVGNWFHTDNCQTQKIQAGSLRKVADSLLFVMTAGKRNCDTPEILSILTWLIAGDDTVCIRALAGYVA